MDIRAGLGHPDRRPGRENRQRGAGRDCRDMLRLQARRNLPGLWPEREDSCGADHNFASDKSRLADAPLLGLAHTGAKTQDGPARGCPRVRRRNSVAVSGTLSQNDSWAGLRAAAERTTRRRDATKKEESMVSPVRASDVEAAETSPAPSLQQPSERVLAWARAWRQARVELPRQVRPEGPFSRPWGATPRLARFPAAPLASPPPPALPESPGRQVLPALFSR